MRIDYEAKLDFDDVLIRPKRSGMATRAEVDLIRTFKTPHAGCEVKGIPVIAANMDTVGTLSMAEALAGHDMFTAVHKHHSVNDYNKANLSGAHSFISFGLQDVNEIKTTMNGLKSNSINKICLDVANGYTEAFIDFVKRVRDTFPRHVIMAGNVATADMTETLVLAGADIVKIGIGPGSVCTTRHMTGVGYPQLSATIECADAAHGLKGLLCTDGGCRQPGDVVKAFAAGADFVMIGGMFAGHKECLSEEELSSLSENDNEVVYYGMSSTEAMTKHAGGVAAYRASEGRATAIKYRGPVENTVQDILGGLRSACTYVGAGRLKELTKRTTFVVRNSTQSKAN